MAKRRTPSTHAVGASLSPESMQRYINEWFSEQQQRGDARGALDSALLADPVTRAGIKNTYDVGKEHTTSNLAARGLAAGGYNIGHLADLEGTRARATQKANLDLQTAKDTFTGTIGRLNNQRSALDSSYTTEAGQNIQRGTGRYKNEKPAGWKPPALQGTPGAAGPAPTTPAPATQPKPAPPPQAPTGARLPTTPGRGAFGFPRLTPGQRSLGLTFAKKRVRLA